MSDRLAISAGFSVVMMAIYALFGSHTAYAPHFARALALPPGLSAPAAVLAAPGLIWPGAKPASTWPLSRSLS